MVYPFSDETMIYDTITHQYALTPEYFARVTGEDLYTRLNTRGVVDRNAFAKNWLRNVSRVLYAYIYRSSTHTPFVEYLLAKTPELRDLLKDALVEQGLYMLANGDISKFSGVDIRRGSVIDRNTLIASAVSPIAVDILSRTFNPNLPCILYQGNWGTYLFRGDKFPCYAEGGY